MAIDGQKASSGQVPVVALGAPKLSDRDAADLEWFWCQGQSLFERSTFGALLERQALFRNKTEKCEACCGSGFTEGDDSCPTCRGMGFIVAGKVEKRGASVLASTRKCPACRRPKRKGSRCSVCRGARTVESGEDCSGCNGMGFVVAKRPVRRQRDTFVDDCPGCELCSGKGYLDTNAAHCGKEDGHEPSYDPDDGSLVRFAQVTHRLNLLNRSDPLALVVLQAFYGVNGLHWGRTKWGRFYAVIPLTKSGRRLLESRRGQVVISDRELLDNVVAQQGKKYDAGVGSALKEATAQAHKLFAVAVTAWNERAPRRSRQRCIDRPNGGQLDPRTPFQPRVA